MKWDIKNLFIFLSVFFYFSCSSDSQLPDPGPEYLTEPVCEKPFRGKSYEYQVVGFYPEWAESTLPLSDIQWDKLTRIIYAFAFPNSDGTINTSQLRNISDLVDQAHQYGVEVYFSVGGGADSDNFPSIAADKEAQERFVREIRQFVFANCLDGVDIDWEYWSGSTTNTVVNVESQALVDIVKELNQNFSPFGLGISIDMGASDWSGKHFFDELTKYVDHLQVMAYDFTGPWSGPGPHSSYEMSIGSGSDVLSTGLAYWTNYRKWPKDRLLLGVPFYGRDFDNQKGWGISYADILTTYPEAWKFDQVANIYYNGHETMAKKTQYVVDNGFSGIMIWQLAQDSKVDSLSLLQIIHDNISP